MPRTQQWVRDEVYLGIHRIIYKMRVEIFFSHGYGWTGKSSVLSLGVCSDVGSTAQEAKCDIGLV